MDKVDYNSVSWTYTLTFTNLTAPNTNGTFTLRERDSMLQTRIDEAALLALLEEKVY